MPAHPDMAVARRAPDIDVTSPVVSPVIDEPEAQPDGIVKIKRRCRARRIGLAPDAVGGKRKWCIRETAALPTTKFFWIAASRRRVLRIKFGKQLTVNVAR